MSVRVEIETDSGTYRVTFPDHESVHLYPGERWSDFECDCHPFWPGTIDTEGLCPDCHREDCDS